VELLGRLSVAGAPVRRCAVTPCFGSPRRRNR
jgi:hypothetical protein